MSWRDDAACKGMDPGLFLPMRGDRVHPEVVAVCEQCPVAAPCLEAAVVGKEVGWWGGTCERQRRRIRAEWVARGRITPNQGRPTCEQDVLDWMRAHPDVWVHVDEMCVRVRRKDSTVRQALYRLVNLGLLESRREMRAGHDRVLYRATPAEVAV